MMKLWGRASSVNVQKVLWALEEAGIAYHRVDAGGRYGVVDTEAFGAMNPMRRVPVLEEDGFILWESNAILRYLGSHPAAETQLLPVPPQERALADQWMEFTTSTLQPAFIGIFWQLVRTPQAERNAEVEARTRKDYASALVILDQRLGQSRFLAGSRFTVADIAAGSLMYRSTDLDLVPAELGHLRRWIEELAARSGYKQHVATSYEELRVR